MRPEPRPFGPPSPGGDGAGRTASGPARGTPGTRAVTVFKAKSPDELKFHEKPDAPNLGDAIPKFRQEPSLPRLARAQSALFGGRTRLSPPLRRREPSPRPRPEKRPLAGPPRPPGISLPTSRRRTGMDRPKNGRCPSPPPDGVGRARQAPLLQPLPMFGNAAGSGALPGAGTFNRPPRTGSANPPAGKIPPAGGNPLIWLEIVPTACGKAGSRVESAIKGPRAFAMPWKNSVNASQQRRLLTSITFPPHPAPPRSSIRPPPPPA
jgi:hypothetical protein